MDGAKYITDTSEALVFERSGRQAYFLRRSSFVRKDGAGSKENLGISKIKLS